MSDEHDGTQPQDLTQLRKDILDMAVETALEIYGKPRLSDVESVAHAFESYVLTGKFPKGDDAKLNSNLSALISYSRQSIEKAQGRVSEFSARSVNGKNVNSKHVSGEKSKAKKNGSAD